MKAERHISLTQKDLNQMLKSVLTTSRVNCNFEKIKTTGEGYSLRR